MFRLIWRLPGLRIATVLLGLAVLWQGWMLIRPRPFPLDARRRLVAEEAAGKLAERMPRPPAGKPTLVVTRFEDDPTGSVTDAVRRAVDRVDRYAVQPTTLVQNALRELGIQEKPLGPEAAASIDMEKLNSDYLLAGRVRLLSARTDKDEAVLEAVLVAADSATGPANLSAEAVRDHGAGAGRMGSAVRSYPWPARLVSWLALALLLPLVFVPLARRGLDRESNAVNLGMLLGLTLVASLAAYAMLGFQLDTWQSAVLMVGAVGLAGVYNWSVLSKLEDLRD